VGLFAGRANAQDTRSEAVNGVTITVTNAAKVARIGEIAYDAYRIVWGPGDGLVSLHGWETPVEVWDITTLKPVRQIAAAKRLVNFSAAADGNSFAWCENTNRVEVQHVRADKPLVLEAGNQQPSVAFSPDGKLLATGGYGTEAKLWKAASGQLVRRLDAGPTTGGLTAVFSPDGRLVAVGNRNSVTRLYDVATGKLLHTLSKVMSQELKFSPDGQTLAVAYVDGSVGLWNVADGKLRHARPSGGKEVYTLDWTPTSDVLATAGLEGKITLWDARDLTALKVFEAPEWVIQVRFSPDGSHLLTAGGTILKSPNRKVTVWGIPADGPR
jgi:WD40 repeat protein